MAYRDFVNDHRKGIIGDALLFYGAEDYLMNWAAERITADYVDEENRDLDLISLEGDRVTACDIISEARAFSMFSAKRVVLVRNYLPLYRKATDDGRDELLEFCSLPNDSAVIIFIIESRYSSEITAFGKKMIKACSSYEFTRLERSDLKAFITKRAHSAGVMIPRRELEHMIDVTGYYNKGSNYDLSRLDSDVDKITRACEGDTVSSALIEDILLGDSDRFVFNLVDALMAGDRSKALSIAEVIIREEDGAMAVLALLTKQFEIMYDSLELSAKGFSLAGMAKMTGVNEYRFKKAYNAAGRYSITRIRNILKGLYNTDRDIKRGDIDKDTALELIAISACP